METNAGAVADFLTWLLDTLSAAVWLVFGTPIILWYKPPISCGTFCYPSAGPFAALSVVLLLIIVLRLVKRRFQLNNLVWCTALFAVYLSLPTLYNGLRVLEARSQQQQFAR